MRQMVTMTVEDLFAKAVDAVAEGHAAPDAVMDIAAQALCLMAVAWRPDCATREDTCRFVFRLVREGLERMERHPFAAGQPAH